MSTFNRTSGVYILFIGIPIAILLWVLKTGHQQNNLSAGEIMQIIQGKGEPSSVWHSFYEHLHHPLSILLLQLILIIVMSRLLGRAMRWVGQPAVTGEILAGILMGPSLLGWLAPSFSAFIFPESSLGSLQFLSQIGLILFMFVIGLELDHNLLKQSASKAIVISHASIAIPYCLGVLLASFIYQELAPPGISFTAFALFMGIAMSITAFPVLARIVQEKGLNHTHAGVISIICAAANDVTAWCILSVVIAIVKAGSIAGAVLVILFAALFIAVMILLIRPLLEKLLANVPADQPISQTIICICFLVLLGAACATEVIGVHALFGAFVAGLIMPQHVGLRAALSEKVEDVALVILLPLFFVLTGLRTQLGALSTESLWGVFGLIILLAVTGKLFGSAFTARYMGESWRDSFTIGVLMNTRGLMELIVLNIGYDLGILSPAVFSIMVFMALITTFMTGPLLNLIQKVSTRAL